jgi:anti-sigma B factor antagonist
MSGDEASVIRDINVRQTDDGKVVTVHLTGEVDLHRSPEVRAELMRLTADKPARLIVNLADVHYMDSSGVATLVQALQQVKHYDGQLIVAAPNARVRSIFEIARLDSIFHIVGTLEEAEEP